MFAPQGKPATAQGAALSGGSSKNKSQAPTAHAVQGITSMPQSLANVLVHIVFSTKDRYPFLRDKTVRHELHAYLTTQLQSLDCPAHAVGGVEDHVHILCSLSRKIATM